MKKIIRSLLVVFFLLICVLLYNTFTLNKSIPQHQTVAITANNDSSAFHLSAAIQIKTISYGDTLPIDTTEFLKFRKFLETSYPLVHSNLPRQIFNEFSYVYKWVGKDTTLNPYVLMGHMDVVPVEAIAESKWTVPSFSGAIKNDTIWGRGAVDDKVAVIAILESVEQLLAKNFTPNRTIYLAFGHDEEVSGKRGAKIISEWFKENNISTLLK
jgi:carboxypeptidase PM20D1